MQDKHPNDSSPNNIPSSFTKNSWDNYLPQPFLHQPSVTSIPPLLDDVPTTVSVYSVKICFMLYAFICVPLIFLANCQFLSNLYFFFSYNIVILYI